MLMSESNVWVGGGHLTVQRDLDGDTGLVEVWEFEQLAWTEDSVGEYDVVKCWVADVNDIPSSGVPHADRAVSGTCSWSEVPEGVRESFIEQSKRLRDAMRMLEKGGDDA